MKDAPTFILHRSAFVLLLALGCAKPEAPPPAAANRIVSLAPNVTEMLVAIGCASKVAGTDNFSDAVKNVPKVGGVEPDVEKIVALKPDLVIASASNAHPNLHRALSSVRIPLLIVNTERLNGVTRAMAEIAQAAGCDARRAISDFQNALLTNRRTRPKPPRILFVVWTDPLYIAGRHTFMDDLYQVAGAANAAEVEGWPQYSLEAFVAHPPDLLLYPDRSVTPQAVEALLGRARVKTKAVAVDEDVFTRPGPRLAIAASKLNRICDEWEGAR